MEIVPPRLRVLRPTPKRVVVGVPPEAPSVVGDVEAKPTEVPEVERLGDEVYKYPTPVPLKVPSVFAPDLPVDLFLVSSSHRPVPSVPACPLDGSSRAPRREPPASEWSHLDTFTI